MALKSKDRLLIEVNDGRLVISIGIKSLAYTTEHSPGWYFETDDGDSRWKVTDPDAWAKSVKRALEIEDEDGTTIVHEMFERVFKWAIEQGKDGIEEA